MGEKSESSSDYDSESEDENGKKRPPRLDENGNPIVRKKRRKGLVGELGLGKGLDYVKNIKIADFNPMQIGQKKPKKKTKTPEEQELDLKGMAESQGKRSNNKNELDETTEDEFESKGFHWCFLK